MNRPVPCPEAALSSAPSPTSPQSSTSSSAAAPAAPALPAAVLWDMDGTLVDTEPCWLAAESRLVGEHGLTWTEEDSLAMIGLHLPRAAEVLQEHGVDLPADVIIDRLLDTVVEMVEEHATWQPGALELLTSLRAAGVPCALVTMSYRRFTETVVARLPEGTFDVVVTGDEVEQGKPHPEPFLRAAEALGVDVAECVAIEDSVPGVAAALASGARTLGVQHIAPVEPRPGLSRVGSLADVDLDVVARIVSGEVVDLLA